MPVTVPLVAPLTVRVSPSPGNDPAVICTAAELSSVSSASVTIERRRKRYRGGILLVGGVRDRRARARHWPRHDRDKRDRGLAVVYSVIDDDLNDAVSRNRIVASRAEADRLQRSLVVGERSDAGERQGSGGRVVSGSGDTARQRAGHGQRVTCLRVRQRDGG